jgi:chromosome segregation ATPase
MMGNQASAKPDPMSKLLDLMANPEKAKAQLSELTTAIEYHKKISREADEKKEQAREAMDALDTRAAAMSHDLAVRENAVTERELLVKKAEADIGRSWLEHKDATEKLDAREWGLLAKYERDKVESAEAYQQKHAALDAEVEKSRKEIASSQSSLERARVELDVKASELKQKTDQVVSREQLLGHAESKLEHARLALQKAVDTAMAMK